jgi:hypothetical protein
LLSGDAVTDEGCSPDELRTLFLFEKLTDAQLDITWRIVVKHHGDIAAESVPGDTRFRVRLPLTQANTDHASS